MEARKKAGPFLPKWKAFKGRHKALSGSAFKPDIIPAITRYDQTLTDYDKLMADQDALKAVIRDALKRAADSGAKRNNATSQITQLASSMGASMGKDISQLTAFTASRGGDVAKDVANVMGWLGDLISSGIDFTNKRKALFDDISANAQENVTGWKDARDDFKAKADKLTSGLDEIEKDAAKGQQDIADILADYVGIADDEDHPEIVKGLQAICKFF